MSRPISTFHAALDRRRWRRVRREVLARDSWTCQVCGRWGKICDHVLALFQGGAAYDKANLQILCTSCALDKQRAEQTRPPPPEVKAWDAYLASVV